MKPKQIRAKLMWAETKWRQYHQPLIAKTQEIVLGVLDTQCTAETIKRVAVIDVSDRAALIAQSTSVIAKSEHENGTYFSKEMAAKAVLRSLNLIK